MKQRNGAGSKRLVEATERFIRSEQKLLEVLAARRILKKNECDHFARDLALSAAKKRSSDVFASAISINRKVMAVLSKGKGSDARARVSDAEVLVELSEIVQRESSPRAFDAALLSVQRAVPFENATLFVLDKDTGTLVEASTVGERIDLIGHVRFDRGTGFSSWVAQSRKPVLLNDLHREGGSEAPTVRSFLSVPVVVSGDLVGVVNLSHSRPGAFDEESTKRVALMMLPVSAMVTRLVLLRESERLGTTDEVTTLFNKRAFDRSLENEFGKAKRYGHKLSVVVLDVGAAGSRERAGSPVTTQVLSDMGKALKRAARGTDCVARYGEDEFRILLPHTGSPEAMVAALRLRALVERQATARRRKVTVNIGVASYPADAQDSSSLNTRAERALLQAKQAEKPAPPTTPFDEAAVH
ncbi:MAG TPA: sensor domain-containing diguanylate cyclase [Candidatus Limnocylindrales bacterium]|nr:sensor domain-containing diguanylate cyclase [Candidatus Limnocylindrales bacterium]